MISELTVLQKCVHPNIMSVTELLEDDDCFYIACELLEGGELFDRIVQVQVLDIREGGRRGGKTFARLGS